MRPNVQPVPTSLTTSSLRQLLGGLFLFIAGSAVLVAVTWPEKFLSRPSDEFGFGVRLAYELFAVHNTWFAGTALVAALLGAASIVSALKARRP